MQIRRVQYADRQEMLYGVRRMTSDGWLVEALATLPHDSYRVTYGRRDPGSARTERATEAEPAA